MDKYNLDPQSRTLHFPSGSCLDSLSFCHAMCCRQWDEGLLASEHESGRYQADAICSWDRKACTGKVIDCIQRRYRLKKKDDNSCFYLGEDSRCAIYADRPKVCRDFTCAGGWQLSSVAQAPGAASPPADASENPYVGELHGAVVLMRNPLIALKAVFYSAEARELVLVTKPVSKCAVTSVKTELDGGPVTEEQISGVYALFDGATGMDEAVGKAGGLGVSRETVFLLAMKFVGVGLVVAVV